MKQFSYVIKDELGIHARPAGLLSKKAKSYADTTVTISANGKSANLGQLMKLMALGVIGEYVGKVYMETKRRPKFILEEHLK